MRLAFLDTRTRKVCRTAVCADALWGTVGRSAVLVCLDLLAEAATVGELRAFAVVTLAIITFHGGLVIAVRHEQAEVLVTPIDVRGTLLPISPGAAMTTLHAVQYLRVLRASWSGRAAHEPGMA